MLNEQKLSFSIVLPLRNEARLSGLLQRLYDPSSADYRHFLSVADFTEQFAPSAADYAAVVSFAKANGLEVTGTPANRMVVPLRGTVGAINSALHVRMNFYQHPTENRVFFSPDREPSLALAVPVAHVAGLNSFSLPKPMMHRAADGRRAAGVAGSGPGGSYLPGDMRAAYYGGSQLTGSGQTVGLLEFGGYDPNDVKQTFSTAGKTYSVPINNVLLDGASGLTEGDDGEQVLDIVQAIGMAPGLSQVRVYIGEGLDDANILSSMASENIAKSISCSWSWYPEDPGTDDVFFKEFAAQGQSFFVASGDYGAWDTSIAPWVYPGEDAYVTTVGGTHLATLSAGGAWQSETAWNGPPYGSGGGISPDSIPIPSWQSGVVTTANGASATLRNGPDVAMEGDFDNYNCALGTCTGDNAGTSFAAPRWAAFIALVNQQASETGTAPTGGIGFLNPTLYSIGGSARYANDFHDIVSGDNLTDGQTTWYNAETGYDLVTGWGSPTGQNLINELAGPQTVGFWLSPGASTVQLNPGATASTSISIVDAGGFSGKVQLAVTSTLPIGVTAAWGTNPTTGSSVLTLTAASTAANTTTLVTITGTSGSLTETTHITVAVHPPSFSLSMSPDNPTIVAGTPTTTSVTVTPMFGFTGSVTLTASGLPTGVTASFGTNPTTGTTLFTIQATSAAAAATSNITITGKSGQLTETASVPIVVVRPTFKLSNGGDVNLGTGSSAGSYIYVRSYYGFQGAVTLSVSGMPSGMTASFNQNPTTGYYSLLTLTTSSTTPLGISTLTVTGKSGDISSTTTLKVNVLAPSFTLGQLGPVQIGQGTTTTVPVYVSPQYGFSSAVSLAIAGLPSGVTATLTPNPTFSSSTLTLKASSTAAVGTSAVTVTGTSGSIKASTNMTLGVFVPTFTLSGSGPVTMASGGSITTAIGVNPLYGFTGSVHLAVSGLPSGVTASISPNPVTGAATLTLTTSTSVALGNSTLTITGTSGTQTATTSIPLSIVTVAFTLDGPGPVTLGVGSSTTAYAQVTPEYGLNGSVTLSLAGLPSGVTASISPNPTLGQSIISLSASSAAKPGTYTVTINGTAPNAKAVSTTFPLTVAAPSFTLANYGQVQLGQGASAATYIYMNPLNGFSGSVHLSVSGLPGGVTASFSPSLITGAGSSELTFAASSTATAGTSTVTVTGTSGSTVETTSFTVQVGSPAFSLSAGSPVTISPASTATDSISVNRLFGFTGSATLSISGLPAGVTASFSPTLTAVGSTLTLTASGSASLGTSTVTVTGVSGSLKAATTFAVTVGGSGFYLQPYNSVVQLAPGNTTTDTISVVSSTGGQTGSVALSIFGLPAGVTASFSPSSTSSSSVLTLTAASTAVAGTTNLTITGTQGKTTATTSLQLQVQPKAFTLSGPSSVTIGQGQSLTNYINVTPVSGFNGAVNLSVSGLPSGVTAAFSANPVQGSSMLTLTASSTAALVSSIVTITGTSGSTTSSMQFPLEVVAPTFVVSGGSTSVGLGTSTTTSVTVQGQYGFSGNVTLSISGLPSGVTASFSSNPVVSNTTITLTASATASTGQYNAVITGTSGKLTATGLLNVTVAAPSFTLSSGYQPPQIGRGTSTQAYVQVSPLNGFTGSVQLSVSGLPSGVSASFLPNPTNSNSTLNLTASSTAPVGEYKATLTGTYGKQIVSIPFDLSIYAPTFTLSSYQYPNLAPGASAQTTVGINPMYGFSGAVQLSASGLPAGVTASFTPASATTQSTLTLTASTSASPGEYNITISGTSGTTTSKTVVPLTIAAPTFTLTASSLTLGIGATASTGIGVYSQNGFSQPLRFTASGLPSGVTAAFSPNPGTGSTTLTLAAAKTVVAGEYIFTVTGTGGGQTATTQTVVDVGVPSFALSAYNVSVGAGYSSSTNVSVNPSYGFNGAVQFSTSGLPAGVTVSFAQTSSTVGAGITISASSTVKPGQYNLNIIGTSGSLVKSTTLVLTVTAPSFSIVDYDVPNLGQGSSVTTYLTVQEQSGFTGNVTFSISGLPSGVTASFSPNPTAYNSALLLTASSTVPAGQYTVTLKGTSGSASATTNLTFVVGAPSFTLQTYGNYQVGVGAVGQLNISVIPALGFKGSVQFSASGLPTGITASFSPTSSTSSATLGLTAASTVKPGQYTFTVTGKSGSLTASTPVSITVLNPTFTLSVNNNVNIGQGSSGVAYIYLSEQYGFTGSVQLTVSGLPSGVTASFSPNPSTGQSVLTLAASSTASLGQYTVIVKGVSGTQSASAAFSLGVYVPTFGLSSSGYLKIGQGTSGSSYVYVNNMYGFTGKVQLSVSGLPAGVTAAFSPNPTTNLSTMTLTASSTAALGQCTLMITGTSGSQTMTTPFQLGVYVPTFTVSGGSPVAVGQGSSVTDYISINAPYGLAVPAQLSITGLPSGVTASFSPNTTSTSSNLTFTAASTAALGQYTVKVTGTAGTQSASTNLTLGVYTPTFTLSNYGILTLSAGSSGQTYIYVNDLYGFKESVQFSLSGLPSGVTASFGNNPSSSESSLTLTLADTVKSGQYTITVTGVSGSQTSSTPLTLIIE